MPQHRKTETRQYSQSSSFERERANIPPQPPRSIPPETLGTLVPDVVLYEHGRVRGIADAKYKPIHPTQKAIAGPQREDLYQIAAYLSGFTGAYKERLWAFLAYPLDPKTTSPSPAELASPWLLNDGNAIAFCAVPHEPTIAVTEVRKWRGMLRDQTGGDSIARQQKAALLRHARIPD